MNSSQDVIAGVGLADRPRKSRWPARMDLAQSLTGLVLGVFMWGHMFFVSSILIGKDTMWTVTKLFEGYFFFGAVLPRTRLGGRRGRARRWSSCMPSSRCGSSRRTTSSTGPSSATAALMAHEDTTLWWVQVITGFMLFFLATVHLYQMMMHPGDIGPYESADRVWSGRWWPSLPRDAFRGRAARRHRPVPPCGEVGLARGQGRRMPAAGSLKIAQVGR